MSQGSPHTGPARRRPSSGGAGSREAGRGLRPREPRGRTVGPRHPRRRGAQRRALPTGDPLRRQSGGDGQRALRHARRLRPGQRPGRHPLAPEPGGDEGLAQLVAAGAPAQRRRAAEAFRTLAGCGGPGRRAGGGAGLRPAPGGAQPAGLFDAAGDGRAVLLRGAGGQGGDVTLRAPREGTCPRGLAPDRPRAGRHRRARLRRLLPHRVGHHRVLPPQRHLLPGARLGRQLRGLLLARHHQRRRRGAQPLLRALPLPGPRRPARHRRRHRVWAARGGHPVRLRALRTAPRRPGGGRDHLPSPLGHP